MRKNRFSFSLTVLLLLSFLNSAFSQAYQECDVLGTPRARRLCRDSMGYTPEDDLSRNNYQSLDEDLALDETLDNNSLFDDHQGIEKDDFFSDTSVENDQDDIDDVFDDDDTFGDLNDNLNNNKPSSKLEPKIYVERVKSSNYDEDLPECKTLEPEDRKPNVNCKEVKEPIVRWRDPVFERLLPQVWRDYQKRMRFERELYGIVIDPLYIGNYSYSESNIMYTVNLNLDDIQVHGLSSIYLSQTLVTRATDLSDLNMMMAFKFDELVINGTYSSTGWMGWSKIDSEGLQDFEIKLTNATVSPTVLVNSTEQNMFGCGEGAGSVVLDISLPMTWSNLNLEFKNIGSMVNSFLNIAAVALINAQENNLVSMMKEQIQNEMNSLICKQDP